MIEELSNAFKANEQILLYSHEHEFCFEKAKQALDDWRALSILQDDLSTCLKLEYKDFCKSTYQDIKDTLFRLVAYCDEHASNKNLLNEYEDKRTIARAGIYQNCWVTQLLKYKQEPDSVSDSIKNIFAYIDDPSNNFPIVSEAHRQMLSKYFLKKEYDKNTFQQELIAYMDSYGFPVDCKSNKTYVYTIALYDIASSWMPRNQVKGIVVRDATEWKEEFREETDNNDGWGIVWWDVKPSDFNQYSSRLRELIDNEGGFPFYIIANSVAEYCFNVVDFATNADYNKKREEWRKNNPIWYSEEFRGYSNGSQQAKIVFLCHGVKRLSKKEELSVSQFKFYSKMPAVKNPAAFTNIISPIDEMSLEYIQQLASVLRYKKNIILQGAPGTGKTYTTASIAVCICNSEFCDYSDHEKVMAEYRRLQNARQIEFCTFHQTMDYEDFVEGLKPKVTGNAVEYIVEQGIFKRICNNAREHGSTPYVLILDEINRGNVSKIFGELITLLEADKRSGGGEHSISLRLPYSKDNFTVPSNLYIIGTMNTTDRSTGSIDYAVRRRFAFVTLEASADVIKEWAERENIKDDVKGAALALFAEINGTSKDDEQAFIAKHKAADFELEDLKVGHSYFMAKDLNALKMKMRYEVVPLIKEYIKDGILRADKDDALYFDKWMKGECYATSTTPTNDDDE